MNFETTGNVSRLFLYFLVTIFLFTKGIYYFLKNPRYQDILAKAFILLIIIGLAAIGIKHSLEFSNKFSYSDEHHELLVLSAAHAFVDKGFDSNFGLPDFNYYQPPPSQVKRNMVASYIGPSPGTPDIYTHLPPGPYLLGGLFVKVCGKGNLSCLRLLSTAISISALLFFATMLFSSLGPLKSAILMFFIAIIPMTRNEMHTFTHTNWAFSLFIIQLGFLLYLFKKKIKLNMPMLAILFILGFIQGWFSFEYFFLEIGRASCRERV